MDLYEAWYTTRAMRRLKPDQIPSEVQACILDAAIHAPNIEQGWRFLLVDDAQIKAQLAPLYLQAFERQVGAGELTGHEKNPSGNITRDDHLGSSAGADFRDARPHGREQRYIRVQTGTATQSSAGHAANCST